MKTFGWICIVLGALSFIGAASAGHSVSGPVFWLALGIALVYFGNQKKEEKKKNEASSTQKPQQPVRVDPKPVQVAEPVKQKSYWENYKDSNPAMAKEIEGLLSIDMSNLSDKDAMEKIQMLDRFSKSLNCSIYQIKITYLKEMEKFPARLIPQMIETTKKEMENEINLFHISENNTCSALMIEWLKERQQNAPKDESYWEAWARENPEKAKAMEILTKQNFAEMKDEDVIQTIESFKRAAETNGLEDWNQIKDLFHNKFADLTKDLCEEEILVMLDHLISEEVEHTKVYPSNTITHYFKIWFEESLKEKESSSLTPEETFRKEYKGKLINKIGSNAFIPLFCEGYDSPIAHEIMYLMYQHLRNGELKAEAERQGLWNKYMQIIVNETEKVTERYCHASLQECIEYYNFPDKKVVTRDRCPNCGSRRVTDDFDFGLECMDCGSTWNAPLGKRLYL